MSGLSEVEAASGEVRSLGGGFEKAVLVFAMVFPALAAWVWLVLRQPIRIRGASRDGLFLAGLIGLAISASCLGLYYGYLKHHPAFREAPEALLACRAGDCHSSHHGAVRRPVEACERT